MNSSGLLAAEQISDHSCDGSLKIFGAISSLEVEVWGEIGNAMNWVTDSSSDT